MSTEPGEILSQRPKEKSKSETKPKLTEVHVDRVVENLNGMDQAFERVKERDASIETETADVSGERGDEIKKRSSELLERAKKTTSRYKEALSMYTKIIILGSIASYPHMQEPVYHESTFQGQVARAKEEIETKGITSEQRGAYIPVVNDLIHEGIEPFNYDSQNDPYFMGSFIPIRKIGGILPNIIFGRERQYPNMNAVQTADDAWRLYLGIPQQNKTFDVSDYRPSKSKDQKYYFKLNGFWSEKIEEYDGNGRAMVQKSLDDMKNAEISPVNWVMNNYTLQKGEDEKGPYISYYDKWDLDMIHIERDGFFGKPYEIYDRLYYDPKTFEPLQPVAKSVALQERKT